VNRRRTGELAGRSTGRIVVSSGHRVIFFRNAFSRNLRSTELAGFVAWTMTT
jgi:hypothetical protein